MMTLQTVATGEGAAVPRKVGAISQRAGEDVPFPQAHNTALAHFATLRRLRQALKRSAGGSSTHSPAGATLMSRPSRARMARGRSRRSRNSRRSTHAVATARSARKRGTLSWRRRHLRRPRRRLECFAAPRRL